MSVRDPLASPWVVEVAVVRTTGSAASYRVFASRSRTILRHSQRRSTREQRGNNRETFQDDHDHPPNAYATHPDEWNESASDGLLF